MFKSLYIKAAVDEFYKFWKKFENGQLVSIVDLNQLSGGARTEKLVTGWELCATLILFIFVYLLGLLNCVRLSKNDKITIFVEWD